MALGPGRGRRDGGGKTGGSATPAPRTRAGAGARTGMCSAGWGDVFSFWVNVFSFGANAFTFRPNVFTLAGEVFNEEGERSEGREERGGRRGAGALGRRVWTGRQVALGVIMALGPPSTGSGQAP